MNADQTAHSGGRSAGLNHGMTVLEVLVTLCIAAILLITGVPAFSEYGQRQRMSASINSLHSHLAMARSEAIHLNTEVVVCPGDTVSGCIESADWSGGWIGFSDLNSDRQRQSLEPIYRAEAGLDQIRVESSSGRNKLRFFPNGSAPGSNGSITFCDRRGPAKARKLVISNLGRIRRDEAPGLDPEKCPAVTG